jgi:hypothetical protein
MCGEVGHQAIGNHYHPSILGDKGVPNKKFQTNDSREAMDMSYIRVTKKKNQKLGKGAYFGRLNEIAQTKEATT